MVYHSTLPELKNAFFIFSRYTFVKYFSLKWAWCRDSRGPIIPARRLPAFSFVVYRGRLC